MGKPECPRKLKKFGWFPKANWSANSWVQAMLCCCLPSCKPYPMIFLLQEAVAGCRKKMLCNILCLWERSGWKRKGAQALSSFLPPLTHGAKPLDLMWHGCSAWWGLPKNRPPPLWACPYQQLPPGGSPDLQLHRAEKIEGLGKVRKSCDGDTGRKNREARQNNLYFVTSASCSCIGTQIAAGNFLEWVL